MPTTKIRLFVYGSLREGGHNNRLLVDVRAKRVVRRGRNKDQSLFSTEPTFTMRDLGSYPAVLKGGRTSILGEVYLLPDEAALTRVDQLEGHPTFYKREQIALDDGAIAWIYLMEATRLRGTGVSNPEVSSGDWMTYLRGAEASADELRTMYFAFGSNMQRDQMQKRCPSATLLSSAVMLYGHKLGFAGWSPTWRGGVATITAAKNHSVPGVLWSLSQRDLSMLDRYEGHPTLYQRVDVEVCYASSATARAWTYKLPRALTAPSKRYLDAVVAGRKQNAIPDGDVLDAAVEADVAEKKRAAARNQRWSDLDLQYDAWLAKRYPTSMVSSRQTMLDDVELNARPRLVRSSASVKQCHCFRPDNFSHPESCSRCGGAVVRW